jgi:hypothetical protein
MEGAFAIPIAVKVPEALRLIDWQSVDPSLEPMDDKLPLLRLQAYLKGIEGLDGIAFFAAPDLKSVQQMRWGNRIDFLANLARPSLNSDELTIPFRSSILDRQPRKAGRWVIQMMTQPGSIQWNGDNNLSSPDSWVPYPQPASRRGDGYLSDWTVLDHDQWWITWKQEDGHRMVYRYIYTNHDLIAERTARFRGESSRELRENACREGLVLSDSQG